MLFSPPVGCALLASGWLCSSCLLLAVLFLPAVGCAPLACCWLCSSCLLLAVLFLPAVGCALLACCWLCSFSSFHHSPDRRCSPCSRSLCPCCFRVVFSSLALWLWFSIWSLSKLTRVPLCGRIRFRGMLQPPPMPLCDAMGCAHLHNEGVHRGLSSLRDRWFPVGPITPREGRLQQHVLLTVRIWYLSLVFERFAPKWSTISVLYLLPKISSLLALLLLFLRKTFCLSCTRASPRFELYARSRLSAEWDRLLNTLCGAFMLPLKLAGSRICNIVLDLAMNHRFILHFDHLLKTL